MYELLKNREAVDSMPHLRFRLRLSPARRKARHDRRRVLPSVCQDRKKTACREEACSSRQAAFKYVVVVCCFYVGGNLLSHTLPSAVPSARAGLASGFGMGPGVSLPLSTTDKHPGHATCVALTWRVLCQILHSGREQQELFILSLRCVAPKPFFGFGVCLFWPISTSSLNILQCFQVWPINPIVFRGPSSETSS